MNPRRSGSLSFLSHQLCVRFIHRIDLRSVDRSAWRGNVSSRSREAWFNRVTQPFASSRPSAFSSSVISTEILSGQRIYSGRCCRRPTTDAGFTSFAICSSGARMTARVREAQHGLAFADHAAFGKGSARNCDPGWMRDIRRCVVQSASGCSLKCRAALLDRDRFYEDPASFTPRFAAFSHTVAQVGLRHHRTANWLRRESDSSHTSRDSPDPCALIRASVPMTTRAFPYPPA